MSPLTSAPGGLDGEEAQLSQTESAALVTVRGPPQRRRPHRAQHERLSVDIRATGRLANRSALLDRLAQAAARRRHARLTGLLYLDVDGLNVVNDVHGHAAGDSLLVAVAQRLAATPREGDLAVRLGGDEFALLVEDLHDQAERDAGSPTASTSSWPSRCGSPPRAATTPAASIGATLITPADARP